ncbi:hypothetical protein MNV49_007818 [Pseudohyphozyma bogoriensis]|nr:hypothetical protein MNV49_007818 [Pseudohyphozyma bogoriensis]
MVILTPIRELSPELVLPSTPLPTTAHTPTKSAARQLSSGPPASTARKSVGERQFACLDLVSDENDSEGEESDSDDEIEVMEVPAEAASSYSMQAILTCLRDDFHHSNFHPHQLSAIRAILTGSDVLVNLPTSAGKSLIYQLSALLRWKADKSVTFIIPPIIALIDDQVLALERKGIKAVKFDGSVRDEKRVQAVRTVMNGECGLVYATAEQVVQSTRLQGLLSALYREGRLAGFSIDEAHYVCSSSEQFRAGPIYKELSALKETYHDIQITALTATASASTRSALVTAYDLRTPRLITTDSFDRPNIRYEVLMKEQRLSEEVLNFIESKRLEGKCGIVYVLATEKAKDLAKELRDRGVKADFYHGGLSSERRQEVHRAWMENEVNVVCATNAFGLGIDKKDVRFVIHGALPRSLEDYYQLLNKGCDGLKAHGAGQSHHQNDVIRLFEILVLRKILKETFVVTGKGFFASRVALGPRSEALLRNETSVFVDLPSKQRKIKKKSKTTRMAPSSTTPQTPNDENNDAEESSIEEDEAPDEPDFDSFFEELLGLRDQVPTKKGAVAERDSEYDKRMRQALQRAHQTGRIRLSSGAGASRKERTTTATSTSSSPFRKQAAPTVRREVWVEV